MKKIDFVLPENLSKQPARSWLFTPATKPERFAKAKEAGADVQIIDLEDSVAPAEKESARKSVLEEVNAAKKIIEESLKGAGTADGKMVDEAVARRARQILSMAKVLGSGA